MAPRRHHSEGSRAAGERYEAEGDFDRESRTRREDMTRGGMEQLVKMFRWMDRNTRRGMEQLTAAVMGRNTTARRREQTPPEILPPPPVIQQGRDPWLAQMKDSGLQRFDGRGDVLMGRRWMKKLRKTFSAIRVPETERVRLAIYHLEGEAEDWWDRANSMEFRGRDVDDI